MLIADGGEVERSPIDGRAHDQFANHMEVLRMLPLFKEAARIVGHIGKRPCKRFFIEKDGINESIGKKTMTAHRLAMSPCAALPCAAPSSLRHTLPKTGHERSRRVMVMR